MHGSIIIGAIAGVLFIGLIVLYNRLVQKRQMVSNGWADIDVQLKRRADLVPQLVSVVQAYAAHEKSLFIDVAQKRAATLAAGDNQTDRALSESALSKPLARMIAIAEDYPDLKASGQFLHLQRELSDTENTIEMARRFFNGAVREFNITVESFPANFLAGLFGFSAATYFEIETSDRALPNIRLENQT